MSFVVRSSCAPATFASVTAELDPVNLADPDPRNLRESSPSAAKRASVKRWNNKVECLPQAEEGTAVIAPRDEVLQQLTSTLRHTA